VGAAPVPFPLLEHIPRDYGDIMIPTLVVPREDALRLQVKHALLLLYYCFTTAFTVLTRTAPAGAGRELLRCAAGELSLLALLV
jgi:hypothetical protein